MLVRTYSVFKYLRRRVIKANDGFVAVSWMRLSDWKFTSLLLRSERMGGLIGFVSALLVGLTGIFFILDMCE